MPLTLAPKEEIVAAVTAGDRDYFENRKYFQGNRIDHGRWGSDEYKEYMNRCNPRDGSTPQYTPEEKLEVDTENSVEEVEHRDEGDGHAQYMTIHFKPYDLYVSMTGRYSSYGDCSWNEVFISEPYPHTETRYRKITSTP